MLLLLLTTLAAATTDTTRCHCCPTPPPHPQVADLLTAEVYPLLHECGLTGRADYVSDAALFTDHPVTTQMVLDVLTDRGFSCSYTRDVAHVPVHFDLTSGQIRCRPEYKHK